MNNKLKLWAFTNHRTGVLSDGVEVGYLGRGFIRCVVIGKEQLHWERDGRMTDGMKAKLHSLLAKYNKADGNKIRGAIKKFHNCKNFKEW